MSFECKCIGKHGSQVPSLLPVYVAPNRRTLNPRPEMASIAQLRGMTMKNKTILGLLLAVCVWGVTANAGQPATTCDRECLRAKVTQLLYAFLKHDVSGLPVADTLRVTEDAVEKPLAKVGLVNTVTRLRGFRQDIIDERAGVAGAHVVVEESGSPVLLVVRVKVVADKLTEVELVATRSRAEGLIFNIDGLSAPSEVTNYAPAPRAAFDPRRGHQGGAALPGWAQRREDFRRRERALCCGCLSLRKWPADGRSRLQVCPRLPEHLDAIARDLQSPR